MYSYLVEFIGTFIFLSIVLKVGEPIPIAVGLLAVIYFGGAISGGHFNPAVSVMMYLKEAITLTDLPIYVIAQVIGGVAALQFNGLTPASA